MNIYDPTYLGLQVAKSMGDELQVFCPYHFDSHPSAEYNVEKGLFFCFGCHESKTAKQLASDLGGSLVPMRIVPDEYRKRPGGDLDWLHLTKTRQATDNEYLRGRGVKHWQVVRHDIRENENGVLFPLRDRFGKVSGMQIRHYTRHPKYLFHGQRTPLWPIDELLKASYRRQETLIITEGIFGALRMEVKDNVQTVAIMGSSSIAGAVRVIEQLGNRRPYTIMDRDWAGQVAAGKFVLNGIPAILPPDDWPDSPDMFNRGHIDMICRNPGGYASYDIMDIVERSDKPNKMQRVLEKYWRKM